MNASLPWLDDGWMDEWMDGWMVCGQETLFFIGFLFPPANLPHSSAEGSKSVPKGSLQLGFIQPTEWPHNMPNLGGAFVGAR